MPVECTSCAESMPAPRGVAQGASLCARCRAGEEGEAPLGLRMRGLRQTVDPLRLVRAIEALPAVAALPASGGSRLARARALADALAALAGHGATALATEMGVELELWPLLKRRAAAELAEPAGATAGRPAATPPVEPAEEAPSTEPPPVEAPPAEGLAEPVAPARPTDGASGAPPSGGVAPEARPGGAAPLSEHLTLVASPFRSFAQLNDFQGALRALPGVRAARVRRFYGGTLQLAVEYDDPAPLPTGLAELVGFRWRLVSERDGRFEIAIDEAVAGDDLATRAAG